jgi:hypothetical protein
MQGPPKRPARIQGLSRGTRRTPAHDSAQQRFPSPSAPSLPLQPALPVYKPPSINSVGDRVTNCLHSFPLNAGLGNNPTNRDLYVRSCVGN